MLNMKQYENQNIINYTKKSNKASDILKYHIGINILEKFIENTEEYRSAIDEVKICLKGK